MNSILRAVVLSVCCVGTGSLAAAQGTPAKPAAAAEAKAGSEVKAEEHHHALTAHHEAVQAHAKALHHQAKSGKVVKEAAAEHAEHMGKGLDAAKKHHAAIQAADTDDKNKPHHEKVKEHHAKASEHHAALQAELAKPAPDPKLVAEHAAGVHHHVKQAEAEHKKLKQKRKVKEAGEPPAAAH